MSGGGAVAAPPPSRTDRASSNTATMRTLLSFTLTHPLGTQPLVFRKKKLTLYLINSTPQHFVVRKYVKHPINSNVELSIYNNK